MAVIASPEGSFHLVHWHLGLAERERHWQVLHLLDHSLFRESAHLPTLIVGDFNDWRNTLAKGPFARHGFHQLTAPRSRFRSFPAYFPVTAIDKAFARGALAIRQVRIAHSKLARDASSTIAFPPANVTVSNAQFTDSPGAEPYACASTTSTPVPLIRSDFRFWSAWLASDRE